VLIGVISTTFTRFKNRNKKVHLTFNTFDRLSK
jgi:hypothetical protein